MSLKLGFTVWNKWYRFLAKPWMCNTLGSLRRLVVVWEQFHDCYLLLTASRILSLRRFLRWNPWVGYFFLTSSLHRYGIILRSFLRRKHLLDIVSQKQLSSGLCTPLLVAKQRRPLGGSSWKLLELTNVSTFLAYVNLILMTYKKDGTTRSGDQTLHIQSILYKRNTKVCKKMRINST